MLESDPDWLPSLHLGHDEDGSRRTERLPLALQPKKCKTNKKKKTSDAEKPAQTESSAGGTTDCKDSPTQSAVRRPVLPLWTDVKSLLQSVLQKKPNISLQPADETHEQPAAVKTNLSFRDFFREALEASLDASSRSRTGSSRTPYKVQLNVQLPPVKEEETCESSCLNCVRLQRRLQELEEKLSRLSGGPESPAVLNEPLKQVLQSPEPVHMEEDELAWLKPVSPPLLHQDGHQDAVWPPLKPAGSQDDSSKRKSGTIRYVPRFQAAWLKTFWFLRYSPTQDLMWCHVCRLHADKSHQNMSLIKGSRLFKVHSIKKHSHSNYHKDSVQRHMLCDLQL